DFPLTASEVSWKLKSGRGEEVELQFEMPLTTKLKAYSLTLVVYPTLTESEGYYDHFGVGELVTDEVLIPLRDGRATVTIPNTEKLYFYAVIGEKADGSYVSSGIVPLPVREVATKPVVNTSFQNNDGQTLMFNIHPTNATFTRVYADIEYESGEVETVENVSSGEIVLDNPETVLRVTLYIEMNDGQRHTYPILEGGVLMQ
ncbi:MAG: hypothetical protein ACRC5C_10625, partial [Bacilli bacterium]